MTDFEFLQNPFSKKWVILSPRRAKRPDELSGFVRPCPFCPGNERNDEEVYRWPAMKNNSEVTSWQIRVVTNKYPFAPIHEVIIHSPDHHKNFDELPMGQCQLIFQTYKLRYNEHKDKGNVIIFHNFAADSGASVSHPHSQLAVIPKHIELDIPTFLVTDHDTHETQNFTLFCPKTSQWPDEVWITPKKSNTVFGESTEEEISDLAFTVARLVQILDMRHGHEFSYNFYINPWRNWYLRLIPRIKKIGGFEIATGVYVNTQDPAETISFIREHFVTPDKEKIRKEHQAKYHRGV